MAKWVSWVKKIEGANASSDVVRAIANRFWGSELAADFSTYEGKALAVKMIQDREYAKECLILCDFLWPISDLENTEDHVGDPTLESQILSAVTGNDVDEEGLYKMGERVFNLHRAIFVRESHQGQESITIPDSWYTVPLAEDWHNPECLMPGKDGEVICRKGAVIERQAFEQLKEEYYQLRGWGPGTGLQTRAILEELGLQEVAEDLGRKGLIANRISQSASG
jgi:aldehyde:ferredoxin oxidoreductase